MRKINHFKTEHSDSKGYFDQLIGAFKSSSPCGNRSAYALVSKAPLLVVKYLKILVVELLKYLV